MLISRKLKFLLITKFNLKIKSIMYIKVQISDEVYKALVASGKRKRGSIALVGPKEGNFNSFSSGKVRTKPRKFVKLPHGVASVDEDYVRLHLNINRQETDIEPAEAIRCESEDASEFIFNNRL